MSRGILTAPYGSLPPHAALATASFRSGADRGLVRLVRQRRRSLAPRQLGQDRRAAELAPHASVPGAARLRLARGRRPPLLRVRRAHGRRRGRPPVHRAEVSGQRARDGPGQIEALRARRARLAFALSRFPGRVSAPAARAHAGAAPGRRFDGRLPGRPRAPARRAVPGDVLGRRAAFGRRGNVREPRSRVATDGLAGSGDRSVAVLTLRSAAGGARSVRAVRVRPAARFGRGCTVWIGGDDKALPAPAVPAGSRVSLGWRRATSGTRARRRRRVGGTSSGGPISPHGARAVRASGRPVRRASAPLRISAGRGRAGAGGAGGARPLLRLEQRDDAPVARPARRSLAAGGHAGRRGGRASRGRRAPSVEHRRTLVRRDRLGVRGSRCDSLPQQGALAAVPHLAAAAVRGVRRSARALDLRADASHRRAHAPVHRGGIPPRFPAAGQRVRAGHAPHAECDAAARGGTGRAYGGRVMSHESSVNQEPANKTLIWLLVLAYFLVLGGSASLRHLNGHSTFYDLGVMDNFVWQTLHGRLFFYPQYGISYFGDHFAPILFLAVPLYAIWTSPLVLILGQALALALGGWFVYQIAHRHVEREAWAWAFTAMYALHPTVLHVAMFDFHPIALMIPLSLAAYYCYLTQRWIWLSISLVLLAACQEEAAITVAAFGVYMLVFGRPTVARWIGATTIVAGTAYFVLVMKVIIPAFQPGETHQWVYVSRYGHLGSSTRAILHTLVLHPLDALVGSFELYKLETLLWLLLPLGLLPLLGWRVLLVALPALGYTYLSSRPNQFRIYYQYFSPILGWLVVAAIQGQSLWAGSAKRIVPRLTPRRQLAMLGLPLTVALVAAIVIDNRLSPIKLEFFAPHPFREDLEVLHRIIGPEASVSVTNRLAPSFAHRREYYLALDFIFNREINARLGVPDYRDT